jgi:hypothetical protein
MLTILGPEPATGFEYRGIVERNRSTARELMNDGIGFAGLQPCQDGCIFAAAALDYSFRYGEHDQHHSCGPQEALRGDVRAHQWNI